MRIVDTDDPFIIETLQQGEPVIDFISWEELETVLSRIYGNVIEINTTVDGLEMTIDESETSH